MKSQKAARWEGLPLKTRQLSAARLFLVVLSGRHRVKIPLASEPPIWKSARTFYYKIAFFQQDFMEIIGGASPRITRSLTPSLEGSFMFHIFVETYFCAGHHLRNYPGNCERPHGHNWKVQVTIQADSLDELGMGIDFRQVKQVLAAIIEDLDHHNLNEHPQFRDRNPSSENIAAHILASLQKELTTARYRPYSVTVHETERSGVTCFAD
jgi:6-pyruvoyltetrahydropterin/6-carboxytetrahydropterin synthase